MTLTWKLGEPGPLKEVPQVAVVGPLVEQGPGQLQHKNRLIYQQKKSMTSNKNSITKIHSSFLKETNSAFVITE